MNLPTKLFHYSSKEIKQLSNSYYDKFKETWPKESAMKPNGLWFSVEEFKNDHNWLDWCKDNQFRIEDLKYKYSLTISKKAKILFLNTSKEVEEFGIKYAANDPYDFARAKVFKNKYHYIYMINWGKVKDEYDGIIIAPYQTSCRFGSCTTWYYPWDCASGCIWNLDLLSLSLHSIIDTDSLKVSEESQEEENETDSLLADLALLK